MAKNKETQPAEQPIPKKPPVKKKNPQPEASLPLYAEVFFTFSTTILLLVTLMIVLVSLMSGAALLEVFLRAVVGVVSLGSLLWFLTYQVSAGLVNAHAPEQTARQEKAASSAASHGQAGGDQPHPSSAGEVKE